MSLLIMPLIMANIYLTNHPGESVMGVYGEIICAPSGHSFAIWWDCYGFM
jgi:hypothetical protein